MKLYPTILMGIALYAAASAQTSTQLFNPAAKEYIYGNTPVASNLVNQALTRFPDDEKLLKLKKLIEEQQQQDQNQDQNQDQQNQDQQQDQNQDQNQDQQNQDQQNQGQQEQESKPEQPKEQQAQPAPPQQAGEMNKEEAQQLLDAMKQNEKDQRSDLRPYLGQPVRVDKDW